MNTKYLKRLNELIKEHPKAILIFKTGKEDLNLVIDLPTPGFWTGKEFKGHNKPVNAICIN